MPSILHAEDPYGEMKALADSAQKVLGQDRLPSINARWIKLARELNDTVQISDAHNNLISHYYQLGDIDHLKAATYEYMDWCRKYQRTRDRYMAWRQYIQRMTEKGMQEEAMAETVRLHQDAEQARDKYGLACGEMCIGYNHRVFGNNVKLCIENYNNALKLFEEGSYYRDAYVVLLNIIQTYLSRSEYAEAGEYLSKLSQLEDKLDRKQVGIDPSLHLRFCEFRVIGLLTNEGRKAAEPYIEETDRFYRQHPESSTPEAWFGYKIMCCRILGDLKGNIAYVDSLMDYQHSLGLCYPYNHYMKGELQEQLGDYRAACRSYARYGAVSDSVRTAEMDDKLSKYTAQFEVDRLKMEQFAIKKETDAASKARLERLEQELADSEEKLRLLESRWAQEKAGLNRIGELKTQIDQLRIEAEKAQRVGDLAAAAEIAYGRIPALERELEEAKQAENEEKASRMVADEVTTEDIAEVVSAWTGIPVGKMLQGESDKLLHMEEHIGKRLIGQKRAVKAVADAVRRSRAGISDPNRPTGSFLFLGPTGVGKTELAKALAQALFDDERNMVRIDMTEYMEKFSVSRLIGAPPGYVGYEEGGQLTEAVRRKPYSVVLFDEVEKAHPDVFNILLQVLDDGRITDSQGRTVDFKNTVIILTSNLGSDIILNDLEQRRAQGTNELSDEAKHQIDLLLRSKFRPEFLNRLDEIVYYKSLTKDEMRKIVDLQLADLRSRMDEGKHLNLDVTAAAKDYIIDSAYDSVYGARPIKRFIQSRVETLIAKAIIQGRYAEGSTLTVDYDGNALVLK